MSKISEFQNNIHTVESHLNDISVSKVDDLVIGDEGKTSIVEVSQVWTCKKMEAIGTREMVRSVSWCDNGFSEREIVRGRRSNSLNYDGREGWLYGGVSTNVPVGDDNNDDSEKTYTSDYDNVSGCDVGGGGHKVKELKFQTNLKNERCHFVLADMLIAAMETMHAEEFVLRMTAGSSSEDESQCAITYGENGEISRCDQEAVDLVTSQGETLHGAESIALGFIADVSGVLAQLSEHDGRQRTLPSYLRILQTQMDHKSLSAFNYDIARSYDMLSDIDDRGQTTHPAINYPVGGCPILGPDLSLPCYIASRSPPLNRRLDTLYLQQNMCPCCKCSFSPLAARRLRLCNYYYLYFCSICYSHTRSIVPARILASWDFTKLPVSKPAYDLLQHIQSAPLFSLEHFSSTLQSSLRVLATVCRLRREARILVHFIDSCRRALYLRTLHQDLPSHWVQQSLLFSIDDFRLMKSGDMESRLQQLILALTQHTSSCALCQSRGFVCELCGDSSDVIFPFQSDVVRQCDLCGTCFHSKCYYQQMCPLCRRCERRKIRYQQQPQPPSIDCPSSP